MRLTFLAKCAAIAAAATVAVAVAPGSAGVASAAPSPDPSKTAKRVERSYVIDDPELIAHPQKIIDAIAPDGTLTIDTGGVSGKVAEQSYVVDSDRFPGGAKPADPYEYITPDQCTERLDQAVKPEGWIKNAFSYCRSWAVLKIAIDCNWIGTNCKRAGEFLATPFLFGYGKIGPYRSGGHQRWADFWLRMNVRTATGPYASPRATIRATMSCKGYVNHRRDDSKCHDGDQRGRTDSILGWRADDAAQLHLVSDASAPNAANAQIAYAVFQPRLRIRVPGGYSTVGRSPDGSEGGLRFDSAQYLAPQSPNDQLGSVFDRADPGFQYRLDDKDVAGVAQHIDWARKNPDSTIPSAPGKHLSGASPGDPIHRLAPGAGNAQNTRYNQNRNTVRAFCRSRQMPTKPAGTECDEYPFASTYEGAARWRTDGARYRRWYSVKWVDEDETGEAGRRLGAWYLNDRILDKVDDEITARDGYFLVVK
ncbi:NucA/NucB deoxyribonuclease domain-containing protein [Actinomadura kijaniata]|uniref:NucA/NucB deoxyribonuclease domain-containing protein n=1 Tax=Actinomadura kijaniata TaxID=46161 RepID=UPI003F197DBB